LNDVELVLTFRIPTYPITATYTGPLGLYLYFKYGRAKLPSELKKGMDHDHQHMDAMKHGDEEKVMEAGDHGHHMDPTMDHSNMDHSKMDHSNMDHAHMDHSKMEHSMDHSKMDHSTMDHSAHAGHSMGAGLPFWAIVLIGVSHCGAGCVLGDLVGEWIVFGSGITINGTDTWPCLLLDYGFALLFGIFFQYFSIAPMSGEWGPKTMVRAAKADILSLTSFEVGLFGWMVAYQVGIWNYRLMMTTWVYWWMMQVGMLLGFATAVPVNWWLLSKGIKEPCV
jgi:hypothetical protein